jgi:hypothetical protein
MKLKELVEIYKINIVFYEIQNNGDIQNKNGDFES